MHRAEGGSTEPQGIQALGECHDVTAQENAIEQGITGDFDAETATGPGGIRTPDQAIMSRLL